MTSPRTATVVVVLLLESFRRFASGEFVGLSLVIAAAAVRRWRCRTVSGDVICANDNGPMVL
jgi:hypothetical protein